MEAKTEKVEELPVMVPLWQSKIVHWRNLLRKNCPSLFKNQLSGFCMWNGKNCYYNGCPRRIFEEYMITEDRVPQIPTTLNVRKKTKELIKKVEGLEEEITMLRNMCQEAGITIPEKKEEIKVKLESVSS